MQKTKQNKKTLQWTNKDAQVAAALDMRGGRERMRGGGGGVGVGWSGGGRLVAVEPRRRLDFLLDVVPEPAAWNRHSVASGGRRAVPSAPAG